MDWSIKEMSCKQWLLKTIGYSLSIAGGDFVYQCIFESYEEYKNITFGSMKMFRTIWSILWQKMSCNVAQIIFIAASVAFIFASTDCRKIVKNLDFWIVLSMTLVNKKFKSRYCQPKDTYSYFIRNSGLDRGSFMAYSFFRGYIQIVVSSTMDTYSKDLKERMEDYEAKQNVSFPIKKLLILQPKSMYIPNKLSQKSDYLEDATSLEEIKINRGGVVNRSYQLSVYKIKECNWYVNVQGASPLITYNDESKFSRLLEKYKFDVGISFRDHLKKLIREDESCRGLVEVIYYDDFDEHGKPVDVGLVLKKFIEESLAKMSEIEQIT